MALTDRPRYLAWLRRWQGHQLVKVVTGVRRCGKSTLLAMFQAELAAQGVAARQIMSFNLEDPDTESTLSQGLALYHEVKASLVPGQTTYVFIDEAQHLTELERTVAGLALLPDVDLYITGSNSGFLSQELATRLTGRYQELHVLPLSFAESAGEVSVGQHGEELDHYLKFGGFPYVARLAPDETMVREYLGAVVDAVLLKDVARRQASVNVAVLNTVTDFMFDNVGNQASIKRISDSLTSAGRKIGRGAVQNYVDGLVEAYLLYPAQRYDIRGKARLSSNPKYYLVDPGLRRARLGSRHADLGHVLENVVFLELLRRYRRVAVGKLDVGEVDFVVETDDGPAYYQVALNVDEPSTLARELRSLAAIPGHAPRTLLVGDHASRVTYDGIPRVNVVDWLLEVA
ncbi:MAG: ATP-binding protein [Propionibacteriaceae bacterium]|jgi:predicted AAA+ superfamily ATPase|nr:ATP-binding protein [Propionibacteriaceae bacterium]